MALPDGRAPHAVVSALLSLLRFWLCVSAGALELIDQDAPELTCSEGLADCQVSSVSHFSAGLLDPFGSVNVTQLQLRVMCCSERKHCKPCLQIHITLQELHREEDVSAESGDESDEETLIKVCFSSPERGEVWKAIQFKIAQSAERSTHQLLLTVSKGVTFGASFVAIAQSKETHLTENITIPSLENVCSMKLDGGTVDECDGPRLRAVMDHQRNVVLLRLEDSDPRNEVLQWQMVWNEITGEVHDWPKDKREIVLSSDLVAPCLCFQVWRRGMARQKSCPFKNQKDALERMQHNVSVSVTESPVRGGGTGLSWNVSAPCKLEAEVWLCKKDVAGGQCEEVTGSRQRIDAGWIAERNGHWHTGEFNMSSHPLLCIQIKIEGVKTLLKPQCPFTTSRLRWSLLLLLGLLLICLGLLGACFLQGILKGYMWRWLKDDDVKGAVGGGHVVLLYPPDDNQDLAELLCHLGSSLQTLGFSVSLDLWSQAELGMLGPVPWLHSRLDQLQRQGGKVVLVLTQATWTRAEEWGAKSWQRNTIKEKTRDVEAEEAGSAASPCADVFSASLSCVLADYLQGRAGERFMLVQFESLPPEPPGSFQQLPQLFRGLHVYSLPSQSLGFLTELAGARQMGSDRRKRAKGLRMASRTLAQRLSSFTAGTNVLHFAGVSQSCVGVGREETVPLQPYLITPPSSPDTNPKVSEMDWV